MEAAASAATASHNAPVRPSGQSQAVSGWSLFSGTAAVRRGEVQTTREGFKDHRIRAKLMRGEEEMVRHRFCFDMKVRADCQTETQG